MARTKQGVSKINKAPGAAGRGRGGARGKDIANGGEKKQIGTTPLELCGLKVASAEFHHEQLLEAVGGGKNVDKRHGEGSSGVNRDTHRDDNVEDGVDGEDRERHGGAVGDDGDDDGGARADGDKDEADEEMVAAEEAEGDADAGEEAEGDADAGEEAEGDADAGEEAEGDADAGEEAEGDADAGEEAEGDADAGEEAEGDADAGEEAEGDADAGEEAEGDADAGEEAEGDADAGEEAEGDADAGEEAEGDADAGEEAEGDADAGEEEEGDADAGEEAEGDADAGEEAEGDADAGEEAEGDADAGEGEEGDADAGEEAEGDADAGEEAEGDADAGEEAEGDADAGEEAEGDADAGEGEEGDADAGEEAEGDADAGEGEEGDADAGEGEEGDADAGEGEEGDADAGEGEEGDADAGEGEEGDADAGEGEEGDADAGEEAEGDADAGEGEEGDADAGEGEEGDADAGEEAEGDADAGEGEEGDADAGEGEEGDADAGEEAEGDADAGEEAEGDADAGEEAEGDADAGEEAEGDADAGEEAEGDADAGEEAEGDADAGEEEEGDADAGEEAEGDADAGEEAEGDADAGEEAEGDADAGEEAEGDADAGEEEEGDADAGEEEEGDADAGEEAEGDADAGEEEEGDADAGEEAEGDADAGEERRCTPDSEEGSGDDSEEEVYTDTSEDGVATPSVHSNATPPKPKVLTGYVTRCFEKIPEHPKEKRRCRKCNMEISFAGTNYTTGRTHMQGQHLNHWIIWLRKFHGGEVGQNDHFLEGAYGIDDEVPDGGVKWVGADTWPAPPTEGVLARKGQQLITQTYPKRFDKDYLQHAMCEWVVATDQAITVVEHPTIVIQCAATYVPTPHTPSRWQFCNMMAAANPECAVEKVIPSRSTLAHQIIRLAGLARIKLMEMLPADGVGAVALMHDIWTGENQRSYISVTGHCVNEKFELMQITLDFHAMPGKHTSARIIEVLLDVVKEWNTEKRCIAVTSDNVSANVAAMEFLCRGGPTDRHPPLFFSEMHVRCMGHICNLAIQLGLKTALDIKEPLGIVRDLASFIGLSPKRTTLFEKIQKRADEKARILRLRGDNEVRWGSTYLMLERNSHRKDAKRLQALTLSSEQWLALEELAAFLKPFHAVSLAAEGSKHPTISRVVPLFNELLDGLDTLKNSVSSPPSGVMKDCITKAEEKLMEYHSSSSDELWVATFLDPSFKIGYFEMNGEGGEESERPGGVQHVVAERVLALVRAKLVPYKAKAVAAREKRERAEGAGRGARGRGGEIHQEGAPLAGGMELAERGVLQAAAQPSIHSVV
ncbi:unnamed protein product [Closterium sp. NIES-64]|nr:unnamed protein product [Closterium sp. NIES-64]